MGEGERGRWGRGRARVRHSGTVRPPAAGTKARDEGNRKGGNVGFHDPQNNIICPCGKKIRNQNFRSERTQNNSKTLMIFY